MSQSFAARQLTRRIAEVAKRTAIQNSPIRTGTVVSRNPDGTLNVDDGRGGCLIQAPAANVRVGQKIKIGTEPSLGSQTSLPLVTLSIDPSTVACPDDPRRRLRCQPGIGILCPEETTVAFETLVSAGTAGNFTLHWVDSENVGHDDELNDQWARRINPAPGSLENPFGGYPEAVVGLLNGTRYPTDYSGGAFTPDTIIMSATRQFLEFDTSSIPAGATVLSATLRFHFAGNDVPNITDEQNSPHLSLCVVPSTADGTTAAANWKQVGSELLGEVSLHEIFEAGAHPPDLTTEFDIDVELSSDDLAGLIGRGAGASSKFAVMSRHDFASITPLVPRAFTNPDNSPPNPWDNPRSVVSQIFLDARITATTKLIVEYVGSASVIN